MPPVTVLCLPAAVLSCVAKKVPKEGDLRGALAPASEANPLRIPLLYLSFLRFYTFLL